MKKIGYKSFVLFFIPLVLVSFTSAREMIVRVEAPDYRTLYQHIPFKGTSIEIVSAQPGKSYDLLLEEPDLPIVLGSGLKSEIVVEDLQEQKLKVAQDGFYCSYDSLVAIMRNWALNYPSICKLESIGQTHQGRWIYAVKISDNPEIDEDEPEVLLDALHHAREWATPQAARYFADTILSHYSTNSEFQEFVDNHELWVIPIVNVDGYVYDYPGQRGWRKNRQPFGSSIGCDPNRNYNGVCNGNPLADWGALVDGSQSSHLPRDATFMGGYGAWGKEVFAMSEFFKKHTFFADVTLHSYGELVLWPYGHGEQTPDNATFVSLGQRIAQQMQKLGGGNYTPQQSNYLYPTNGGSDDWMYGWGHHIGGFPCISFCFEIGTDFYQPQSQLDAIQQQVFKGIWYLFTRADSISAALEGVVPRPILAPMDSNATGFFTVHWTPIRPEENHPEKWELEELSGLTVIEDSFEFNPERWEFHGASISDAQKHSGGYSVSLGNGNNISNYAMTKDPYPVQSGDSLRYWIWYNTENNYDVVVTEVSLEGKEWIQLHDRYTGNSSGWVYKSYSLEPWVGKTVFIRFRYMTDGNTLGSGVYVDDVWPVPSFTSRRTVDEDITDTLYEVSVTEPGQYWYRVRGYNSTWGWGDKGPLEDIIVTSVGLADKPVKRLKNSLEFLSSNPTSSGVNICYTLGSAGPIQIDIFDVSGRKVKTLFSGNLPAGEYQVRWNGMDKTGSKVSAGVYFCRMVAGDVLINRMVLLR